MNRAILSMMVAASLATACGDSGGSTATDGATSAGPGTGTTNDPTTPTSTGSASETGSTGGSISDSNSDATTQSPTTTNDTGTTGTTGTTDDTTAGTTGTTTGTTGMASATDTTDGTTDGDTTGGPCGGPGEPDVSYIWIANSSQGTISKINTQTLVEEGRYIVRPDSNGSPSRTSVSLTGDVAVANRNGGLTKVYARSTSCVESNGMPGIQTSTDSNFLPWGVEECIAWYTPMVYQSQRPVAWTQGTFNQQSCLWENQKVWTSAASDGQIPGVDIMRVDGYTGAIEAMKNIPEIQPQFFGMYGAAVDKDGNMWASQLGQGTLLFVEHDTLNHKTWPMASSGYGMTVGASGYVWTCSSQVGRFDPMTEMWQVANVNGSGGCMEDDAGTLYVSGGNNNVVAVDVDTMQVKATYPLPEYVHGISIDYYGYVWGVGMNTSAYRLDIMNNGAFQTVTGLVFPYTYSDMTGVALANVAPQ